MTLVTIPVSRLRALTAAGAGALAVGVVGELLGQPGQVDAGARSVRPDSVSLGEPARVDPAAHGVVADAEQLGGFRDPVVVTSRVASAVPQMRRDSTCQICGLRICLRRRPDSRRVGRGWCRPLGRRTGPVARGCPSARRCTAFADPALAARVGSAAPVRLAPRERAARPVPAVGLRHGRRDAGPAARHRGVRGVPGAEPRRARGRAGAGRLPRAVAARAGGGPRRGLPARRCRRAGGPRASRSLRASVRTGRSGLLTDDERFVGVRQEDDQLDDLLATYVDEDAEVASRRRASTGSVARSGRRSRTTAATWRTPRRSAASACWSTARPARRTSGWSSSGSRPSRSPR